MQSITNVGVVTIAFNDDLIIPANYTNINDTIMRVKVIASENSD
jgi:hypothetical protein